MSCGKCVQDSAVKLEGNGKKKTENQKGERVYVGKNNRSGRSYCGGRTCGKNRAVKLEDSREKKQRTRKERGYMLGKVIAAAAVIVAAGLALKTVRSSRG